MGEFNRLSWEGNTAVHTTVSLSAGQSVALASAAAKDFAQTRTNLDITLCTSNTAEDYPKQNNTGTILVSLN